MSGPTLTRRTAAAAGAAALALTLSACGGSTGASTSPAAAATVAASSAPTKAAATTAASAAPAAGAVTGALTLADQASNGKTLTVADATLKGVAKGWIAVHSSLNGKPGPVVGHAQISEGDNRNVVVTFDKPVTSGEFFPMLHVDNGVIGTYEFPTVAGVDLPVMDSMGVVVKPLKLTVA